MAKEIILSSGSENRKVALVSEEDFDFLSQWKWSASLESRGTKWYAIRWSRKEEHGDGKRFKIRMHRVVAERMGPLADGQVIDHLDANSLNNQRYNLEPVTQVENMDRSKGWKGSREFRVNKAKASEGPFTYNPGGPVEPIPVFGVFNETA